MGRPRKLKEDQRQPITVRLSPATRALLGARARESGVSLASEVEARVTALAAADSATVDLVATIVSAIERIQGASKKRWHRDLRTWAAVAAMLGEGPINDHRPDLPDDDEQITDARDAVWRAAGATSPLTEELAELGIVDGVGAGIDWIEQDDGTLSFSPDRRSDAWRAASLLPEADRVRAETLLTEVEQWDEEQAGAIARLHHLERPYREAEESGHRLYRSVRQKLLDSHRVLKDGIGDARAPLVWRASR